MTPWYKNRHTAALPCLGILLMPGTNMNVNKRWMDWQAIKSHFSSDLQTSVIFILLFRFHTPRPEWLEHHLCNKNETVTLPLIPDHSSITLCSFCLNIKWIILAQISFHSDSLLRFLTFIFYLLYLFSVLNEAFRATCVFFSEFSSIPDFPNSIWRQTFSH